MCRAAKSEPRLLTLSVFEMGSDTFKNRYTYADAGESCVAHYYTVYQVRQVIGYINFPVLCGIFGNKSELVRIIKCIGAFKESRPGKMEVVFKTYT